MARGEKPAVFRSVKGRRWPIPTLTTVRMNVNCGGGSRWRALEVIDPSRTDQLRDFGATQHVKQRLSRIMTA